MHKFIPELNLIIGDVRALPFPDNHFAGYWSLGVIEHFFESYSSIALEMARVLMNEGFLFLSFPYMSPVRKWKGRFAFYQKWDQEKCETFYQFALNWKSVCRDFEKCGFRFIKCIRYDKVNGILEEIRPITMLLGKLVSYRGKNALIKSVRRMVYTLLSLILGPISSHCILLIMQKSSLRPKCWADVVRYILPVIIEINKIQIV